MKLLIDGYNLMYGANITGRPGPGSSLHRSRHALLQELAQLLTAAERNQTTIVFDAQNAPPGLPKQLDFAGIQVVFAPRNDEADDMIIEIIQSCSHARSVTVVSSDHRIQVAARSQGASVVDSDEWFQGVQRRQRSEPSGPASKPIPEISEQERLAWLEHWERDLREFSQPLPKRHGEPETSSQITPADESDLPGHPFPPGYAEDVIDEDLD